MPRTFLKVTIATIFVAASCAAWAAGPNDGPKYPNMATNKHYADKRIMDHNNGAPRYAVTATGKHYADRRIMDHNNAAPRYAVTTAGGRVATGTPARVHARRSYVPRSRHANAASVHHG